jgi:hypothetical protein
MSTDTLHSLAQADTPSTVDVPKDMTGLLFWAIGRFGSGILLAMACGYALTRVYEDHAKQTQQLMTILETRAKLDSEMTSALVHLTTAIDQVAKDAQRAHNTHAP